MIEFLFWFSMATLFYAYVGYRLIIKFAAFRVHELPAPPLPANPEIWPKITVIVVAHNEEAKICKRIDNLLQMNYPVERLEIMIVSDGSNDRTVALSRGYQDPRLAVLDLRRSGRGQSHNVAVRQAKGEIIVFTDADSEFKRDFLTVIAEHLRDSHVGCVVARLIWRPCNSAAAHSRNVYWRLETELRRSESLLGLLTSGTGAGMALKKELWRPMGPKDDVDSVAPLDVILQKRCTVFAPKAVVYDDPYATALGEYRSRVRGVSRSLVMILQRWGLKNWWKHPAVSWALLSHNILKWVCPYFIVTAAATSFWLAASTSFLFYQIAAFLFLTFFGLVTLGWIAALANKRLFLVSTLFSFAAASAGMAIGVFKGLTGAAPVWHAHEAG